MLYAISCSRKLSENTLLATAALFLSRILGQNELIFKYKTQFVHSQLHADTTFAELEHSLLFSDRGEAVAEVLSFEPFQVFIQNWTPDHATTQWWQGHFETICCAAEENPHFLAKRFCFLSQEEKKLILETWNDTDWEFPDRKMLHEFIEEQCQKKPNEEAVRFGGRGISYYELNAKANQLAHRLRRDGIEKDQPVAICMERSIELVIGLLAILKAGGAYVPMDPSYPEERLLYILSDSKAKVLLIQRSFAPRFQTSTAKTICCDHSADFANESLDNPTIINTSDDLCYIIYTSGSTGKPKGAGNIHRGVVNRILWMHNQYHLEASDRVLQKTPFGFDVSVWEFFWPLMTGATLVMAEPRMHKDAEALANLIKQERITILHFVPSMLELFLEATDSNQCRSLKKVFTSGEALSKDVERRFFQKLNAELHNLYGPTEASIDVTYWSCQPNDNHNTVPIGYPIANTQIYILDEFFQPVPIGAPGELFIGGVGLARGYIHREELTREKFIFHAFLSDKRIYRTGDLCRFLGDGAIEYLGRIDHQIKLRGFRIELAEIEIALRKHVQVKTAAVIVREDIPGQKYLAAYLITAGGNSQQALESELISTLSISLPEYMVPSSFVFLDTFPLSPNGKLDTKNLPKPQRVERKSQQNFVSPRNAEEIELQKIWTEILGIQNIGILDGFFSLGGHSLLAMRLVLKIRQKLKKYISLPEIFSCPTIGEQVQLLRSRETNHAQEQTLQSVFLNRFEPFPLTDIQRAYIIGRTDAFSLGGVCSHVYAENVRADIDVERLEQAFNQLIGRHDMLRAIILEDGTQQVLPHTPYYKIEVSERPKEEIRESMRLAAKRSPFLFDIRLSADRVHFLFNLLIADGTGLEIIFEELSQLYDQKPLQPAPQISYRDCVVAMEQHDLATAQKYWFARIDQLPDAPELPLKGAAEAGPFVRYKGQLSAKEWKSVQKKASDAGVSPAAYLVTLYGEAIKTYSRYAHFTLNVMFFNRPPLHPDVDQVVGNFSTTLLLEMNLQGQDPISSKAHKVQHQLLQDLEHAAFNGIKVLNEKNRRQGGLTAAAMPIIFACALNLRSANRSANAPNRFEWYGETVPYNHLETPQVLLDHQVFEEKNGSLCFHWDVRDSYFAEGIVNAMFQIYLGLLKGEEQNSASLQIAPEPHCQEGLLHKAFFEQAQLRPDRAALFFKKGSFTYGELAATSLHLADRLQTLALKPDDLIAVIMDKGWEQIAAVLGIHAAGAAYLPIDAALPEERIRQILSVGRARAAIIQKPLLFEVDIPCFFVERKEKGRGFTCIQQPSDLAYVIFTSGSTGIPKGVMIEHRSALNTIEEINRKYGITENDRCFAAASLSFDLSVYDIFGFLSIGASLYIPGKEEDPSSWLETIQEKQITLWNSTPALVQILIDQADLHPPRNPTLRILMMSGDWIPIPLPDLIRRYFPAKVYSLGGATEASIWSNDYPIDTVDPSWPSIPYGTALSNQTMEVMDEDFMRRATWATGAIYIGGHGLARGYLGDPEKTVKSFVFHPKTGKRLYRTGDLGRYLPDGNIEFLGREDLQAKVQGYRIELEEIESAIYRFGQIQQAAVRIQGQKSEAKKIAAFFIATTPIDVTALEAHLSLLLPAYMVPHHFLQLEAFPLSANGKVDTKALLSKLSTQANVPCSYSPPENALEEKMAKIWSSLLQISTISRHDNFFAIGGTSFLAFRMVFLMQKELGLTLSVASLFQKGTIAQLSQLDTLKEDPSFVTFQSNGTRTPLFLIHPSGGGALCYTELASRISDRPIYAFQAPGFLDERPLLPTIIAMAEHYLKILLRKQPDGPYFLGGWSLGGVVAYEMAYQLQEMGKSLTPILFIDSPSPYAAAKPEESTLLHWFEEDYGDTLAAFDSKAKASLFRLFCNNLQALRTYSPPQTQIRLIQWKAEIPSIEHLNLHPDKNAPDWGWSRMTSGTIEQHAFHATHASILQAPSVQNLATRIMELQ